MPAYSPNPAADVRAALRAELGLTSRQVSVRLERFSMGRAVNVTIKARGVAVADVTRIARGNAEEIRRCTVTGDILGGGNTYVSVHVADELIDAVVEEVRPRVLEMGFDADEYDEDAVPSIRPVPGHPNLGLMRCGVRDFETWDLGHNMGVRIDRTDLGTAIRILARRVAEGRA